MLASITPLGERARGSSWGLTVAFFVVGSVVAGAGVGALLGALGSLLMASVDGDLRLAVLAVALAVGLALDLGGRLPSPRRQVNEDWLREYRGWVYGLGFGGQLGAGFATIVTTSLVYVALLAAFLAGDVAVGALIVGACGAARGLSLLAGARVTEPAALMRLHASIDAWRPRIRGSALVAQALLVVALVVAVGA
jgi:hypothetical protein